MKRGKKSPTEKFLRKYKLYFILAGIVVTMFLIGFAVGYITVQSSAADCDSPPVVEYEPVIEYEPITETEPVTETTSSVTEPEDPWLDFVATAYCSCEKCCGVWATMRELDDNGEPIVQGATGVTLKQGVSVAADTTYPIGTNLEIEGMGTYIVHDRGGAIKGNRLDIYFDNHNDALEFGVQNIRVRVVEK